MTPKKFAIEARSCTLLSDDAQNPGLLGAQHYVIPVYQRPYSWGNEQVARLLKSIVAAYLNNQEPYFLGTMQLMPKQDQQGAAYWHIVDGQQRLTTLLLFFKALQLSAGPEALLPELRDFTWLRTTVSQGEQQKWLDQALHLSADVAPTPGEEHNPYVARCRYIQQLLGELAQPQSAETPPLVLDAAFLRYVAHQLYVVVIETQAGLAKTLDIFNTINTAGMDLNGGDVFKLQIFEYLMSLPATESFPDEEARGEAVFKRIDAFYAAVDATRHPNGSRITSVHELLSIYQAILIERAKANGSLHDLGMETFYKRLFATLLLGEKRDHYKPAEMRNALGSDPLADLHRLLEVRRVWETSFSSRHDMLWCLLSWRTRYEQYWKLDIIYLFRFYSETAFEKVEFEQWHELLVKYYIVRTIQYRRVVNDAHRFSRQMVRKMLQAETTPGELITRLRQELNGHNNEWFQQSCLRGDVFDNQRQRYLIFWLLALLEEGDWQDGTARTKFFGEEKYDVEHIRPRNPAVVDAADNELWKNQLNTLGNLVLLERDINRSSDVLNHPFERKQRGYADSNLKTIERLRAENADNSWTLAKAQQRTSHEAQRLSDFLFAGCSPSPAAAEVLAE